MDITQRQLKTMNTKAHLPEVSRYLKEDIAAGKDTHGMLSRRYKTIPINTGYLAYEDFCRQVVADINRIPGRAAYYVEEDGQCWVADDNFWEGLILDRKRDPIGAVR